MATHFKRLCCQAVRSTRPICSRQITSASLLESSPRQMVQPLLAVTPATVDPKQQRSYTTTVPKLAVQSRRKQDEESTELQRPGENAEPDYLMDESQISSLGHGELDQHREIREMMRTAAWEMPLLTQLAKPFEYQNPKKMPLRWRYTTYMGDSHPASRKVVVEFDVKDLPDLTDKQVLKMQKLVGPRLNPKTNVVRMSCDSFETQAQNKRYLGDIIQKLIAEVKDPNADTFEDIPLDTRHFKPKRQLEFPEEWKLTPERKAALDENRKALLLEEGKRVENGEIVSGIAAIEVARQLKLDEQPVLVAPSTKKSARGGRKN